MFSTGPALRSWPELATHRRAMRTRRRAQRKRSSRAGPDACQTDRGTPACGVARVATSCGEAGLLRLWCDRRVALAVEAVEACARMSSEPASQRRESLRGG